MIILSDSNNPSIAYEIPNYTNLDTAHYDILLAIKDLVKERERQRLRKAKNYVPTGKRPGRPKATPIIVESGDITIQKIQKIDEIKPCKKTRGKQPKADELK
jgi:hypothetical protein